MSEQALYFSDNFFSAGKTDIYNEEKVVVGQLDLKSAFSSSVDVMDQNGKVMTTGHLKVFSNRWYVQQQDGQELGILRTRFAFFKKKFEYRTQNRGVYLIYSEAFSSEYTVLDEQEESVAKFEKVSGFFSSPVFRMNKNTEQLSHQELVTVVMGVNMINKRRRSSARGSHS